MMLPVLRTPAYIPLAEGRRMVWAIPTPFVPFLAKVMWEEAAIVVVTKIIDKQEAIVTINYTASKMNFAIFACDIFKRHYTDCRTAEAMFMQRTKLAPPDDYVVT